MDGVISQAQDGQEAIQGSTTGNIGLREMWMRAEVRDDDPVSSVGAGRQEQLASGKVDDVSPRQEQLVVRVEL